MYQASGESIKNVQLVAGIFPFFPFQHPLGDIACATMFKLRVRITVIRTGRCGRNAGHPEAERRYHWLGGNIPREIEFIETAHVSDSLKGEASIACEKYSVHSF